MRYATQVPGTGFKVVDGIANIAIVLTTTTTERGGIQVSLLPIIPTLPPTSNISNPDLVQAWGTWMESRKMNIEMAIQAGGRGRIPLRPEDTLKRIGKYLGWVNGSDSKTTCDVSWIDTGTGQSRRAVFTLTYHALDTESITEMPGKMIDLQGDIGLRKLPEKTQTDLAASLSAERTELADRQLLDYPTVHINDVCLYRDRFSETSM